jgi:hypothetical protein
LLLLRATIITLCLKLFALLAAPYSVLVVKMRVSLAVFTLLLLIQGGVGLELQQSTHAGQTFEEFTNGNNSLCDHFSTVDHFAGPELPSGCPTTAAVTAVHSSADQDRQSAETTPTSRGAFVAENFPAATSKMMSLMLQAQNETFLRGDDCGHRRNCSMFASHKFEEDFADMQDQVAFYLTVFYLAALMGASFFAFYCICRFRRNTTNSPDHHV